MGQEQGIGFDGLMDDRPRAKIPKSLMDIVKPERAAPPPSQTIQLQLRWERALPVRVAELKAGVIEPPTLADEGYSIAVYGFPASHVKGDPKRLGEPFAHLAALKREGKRDVQPSSVEVFERENGLVIVYLFPFSAEISRSDRRVEFSAQVGRIHLAQSFDLEAMRFQGNLEM